MEPMSNVASEFFAGKVLEVINEFPQGQKRDEIHNDLENGEDYNVYRAVKEMLRARALDDVLQKEPSFKSWMNIFFGQDFEYLRDQDDHLLDEGRFQPPPGEPPNKPTKEQTKQFLESMASSEVSPRPLFQNLNRRESHPPTR